MEQHFYLLTGVMASGKSTTAQALAERLPRCVHLRGDVFRKMIVTGREEMTSQPTPQALEQLHLRYRLAAQAAGGYWEAGFSVVLQDNYYGPALEEMLSLLAGIPVQVVVLCPGLETVKAREKARDKTGYGGFSPEPLWDSFMRETPRIGFWLDNSSLTVEESVEQILSHGEPLCIERPG